MQMSKTTPQMALFRTSIFVENSFNYAEKNCNVCPAHFRYDDDDGHCTIS